MRMIESSFKTQRRNQDHHDIAMKTKRFEEEFQESLSRNTKLEEDPEAYDQIETRPKRM
jgi:hypothetical protein